MEKGKIENFLNYLLLPTTKSTVDESNVTLNDAQKELDLLIQNESEINQLLSDLKENVKELREIIDLSKRDRCINSAKKRAENAVKWPGVKNIKAILEQIQGNTNTSSANTRQTEIHQKGEEHRNNDVTEVLERSRKAGAALVHDNPDITDLSDPNRPTKIAERFSELYDNEWTDAFDAEVDSRKIDEKKTITELMDVIKSAYKYCTDEARERIKDRSPEAVDYRNRFRKTEANTAIPGLQRGFMNSSSARLVKHVPKEKGAAFVNKCVELCWWMCIQERPVYMCNVDDTTDHKKNFNADLFRAYTKSGSDLDYLVWPALTLYKDGPVLYRGVAQFK